MPTENLSEHLAEQIVSTEIVVPIGVYVQDALRPIGRWCTDYAVLLNPPFAFIVHLGTSRRRRKDE